MTSLSLIIQPSPNRTPYLVLAGVFALAVAAATISFFIYPAPVFTWQQLQELQPQQLPLYSFERGNLEFTISGENYLLFERWLGNQVRPNLAALDVYLVFLGLAVSGLLTVISALPRFWFYAGSLVAAFFFAVLRWETLLLFNADNQAVPLAVILLVLGVLSWLQFFRAGDSVGRRFLAMSVTLGILGVVVANTASVPHPLRLLAVNTLPPAIALTLIFLIVIAHQLFASFVSLATASSKTQSLRHFLIISTIFLLNLWLAYWDRIAWLDWDYTLPSFLLLAVSGITTVWTIRQRIPVYEGILRSDTLLVCFALALGTAAFSVYGFFLSTANDISLLSMNDLILYAHLGYGMMFIVYVAANFLGVFEKNLHVERVLYKPRYMPYFTYRLAGLITTLAFVFYNTWFTHVNHFTSGYYTAMADVHLDQPTPKAAVFYKRAHYYASYNQYASTVLAGLEATSLNYGRQLIYTRDANSFHPTEFTLLNEDDLYLSSGNAYAEIRFLRRAKEQLPSSGLIRNNLGLALSRANLIDSSEYYFQQALETSASRNSAELNLLATLAKSGKPINVDSLALETADESAAIKGNVLAVANRSGKALRAFVELPPDSVFDLFTASLVANYITNQTNKADTFFLRRAVALAQNPKNASFRHLILSSAARAYYASGMVNRAVQLMQETVFLNTNPGNDNYTLGLMAMDQEKHDVAINLFYYALQHGSASAALANAVCLAEEGRINEAVIAWDTISRRKDSVMHELGESMKRILAAPRSWFDDLSDNEKLYYTQYRIPLSDSTTFSKLAKKITSEDLRARAYLNRARQHYRVDDVGAAARQFRSLQGLHLRDTELFAEIKYFEMRILAASGRIDDLWEIIGQGILFGPYRQSEKLYYEALRSWAARDTASVRQGLDWLAQNNWYFDEGVVLASRYHSNNPQKAYHLLAEALQVNPRSIRILKAYVPIALARGLDQYAADALQTLRDLLSPSAFDRYVSENQLSGLTGQ